MLSCVDHREIAPRLRRGSGWIELAIRRRNRRVVLYRYCLSVESTLDATRSAAVGTASDLHCPQLVRFGWHGFGTLGLLAIVNAVTHLAGSLVSRAYNPGLVTAVVLFLLLGICSAIAYSQVYATPLRDYLIALALAIALHVVIIFALRLRRASFRNNERLGTQAI